jgi:hypothetical protein
MMDFEKLGLFYLGRREEAGTAAGSGEPVLYDSRDLVTHGVAVGMTGSGKTGLCVTIIEEAAIDGIPVIAIDPKGDLGNLLLAFPNLSAAEFRPWIDEDEARRAGSSPDAFAASEAARWSDGLTEWGQDKERIARLQRSAEFVIYTPGSTAGAPVSIVKSFAAPPAAVRSDAEALGDRAAGAATSLLDLAGAPAAPRSREHTLLSSILASAWREGQDLDLEALIARIQSPPFDRVGVADLEAFFPSRERFELAMRVNGLLAAPGFDVWLQGEPLDPAALLYAADGKPRVAIFSIAHLSDPERMFFVSLLLNQVVSWMRGQPGTSSLRALVYMDEIAGYFPPVANPPSKTPLLTLLKQGRAFGVGVLLATQNPVDLDYKGLSNIGTWFLGRLQTERDKARVLDGLEGAAAGSLARGEADRILSGLGKRQFLLHNVHDARPTVFRTRWALTYLRGPLTREQIRAAMQAGGTRATAAGGTAPPATAPPRPASGGAATTAAPRAIPPEIEQYVVPGSSGPGGDPAVPVLLGAARVHFTDAKLKIDAVRDVLYAAPFADDPLPVDWSRSVALDVRPEALRRVSPGDRLLHEQLPSAALQPKNYAAWTKSFARWVAGSARLSVFRHRSAGAVSAPGESERDFQIRLRHEAHAARDAAVDEVRRKYAAKRAALAERLRRAEAAVGREQEQASQQKTQTAVSLGATVLGALFGRKAVSTGTLGRATTTVRGVGRSMQEAADVKRAEETVTAVRAQLQTLDDEAAAAVAGIAATFDQSASLERVDIAPKRASVDVQFVALGWMPSDGAPGR